MSDRHRFEKVYVDHYDSVLRYCLRRSDREDALDATAETFAVAWRRRSAMPAARELPWLYGVARRVLANQRRSQSRRQAAVPHLRVLPDGAFPEPEPQVVRNEEISDVGAALARLKANDPEIIRLAGWEELGREELAYAMGCTPNAVPTPPHPTRRLCRGTETRRTAAQ